jgi:hypothetical protein
MADNNTVNQKLPVQFILPDSDMAAVCTWAYIIDRLESNLTPTLGQLEEINTQLGRINTRLGELVES